MAEGENSPELGPDAKDRLERMRERNRRQAQAAFEHSVETQGEGGGISKDTRPEAIQEQIDKTGLEDTLERYESPAKKFKRLTSKDK